ncbi:MAG: glycosyltransferase family 4 protein [Candidatus Binatia bacterium]
MRIAQVAPLYESVPPRLYGGTERVVAYLTEALVDAGHAVTLFASGDSRTRAELVPQCEEALRLAGCDDPIAYHVRMHSQVYRRAADFDLIHCHTDYLSLPTAGLVDTPTLITLHGRLDIPALRPLYADHGHVPLVSISDAQRVPLPAANWLATVYHGLPPELYRYSAEGGDYLLFLGRLSPEKCPDTAIRAARRAGIRLRIAAKVDGVDKAYFTKTVEPLLDDPLVEFIGEVGEADKEKLLRGALALLFPIDWPEPFGLVMIESLACGTPVIARPRGSVPEVLRHGVTGLVCETEDMLVDAIRHVRDLDRAACRAEFEQRFTVAAMTRRYLDVYAALVGGSPVPALQRHTVGCLPSAFA